MSAAESPDARATDPKSAMFAASRSGWDFEKGAERPPALAVVAEATEKLFFDLRHTEGGDLKQLMAAAGVPDMDDANLRGADLRGQDLSGISFIGADFTDADLTGAKLNGCDLKQALFHNAKLADAELEGANTQGAVGLRKPRAGMGILAFGLASVYVVSRLFAGRSGRTNYE